MDKKRFLTVLADRRAYFQRLLNVVGSSSVVAYWPLWESSGATAVDVSPNGLNGAYSAGVTYGQPGIGDGRTSCYFGGTSRVNLYSAGLATALPTTELSYIIWASHSAAVWAAGVAAFTLNFRVDVNNRFSLERSATANTMLLRYMAGGTNKVVTINGLTSEALLPFVMTVSKSNDRLRGYVNGSKFGADVTGLGTWVGTLNSSYAAIASQQGGADSSPDTCGVAHVALINRELTAAEVATLSSPFELVEGIFAVGDSKTASAAPGVMALLAGMRSASSSGWFEASPRLAVSGIDTATMKTQIDAALANVDATSANRVRHVLYNLGANDNNSAPVYATFYADTEYCLLALHAKFPNATIWLARVWERGDQTWLTTVQHAAVTALAVAYSWARVGVDETAILEAGDDGATWTSDGTHPTSPAGYVREWADPTIGWISYIS